MFCDKKKNSPIPKQKEIHRSNFQKIFTNKLLFKFKLPIFKLRNIEKLLFYNYTCRAEKEIFRNRLQNFSKFINKII